LTEETALGDAEPELEAEDEALALGEGEAPLDAEVTRGVPLGALVLVPVVRGAVVAVAERT
jgi:hypothetical protein